MTYIIITISLIAIQLLYFRIADKYNIIDKPNERSSHSSITIRGGAIIIPIAFVIASFKGYTSWYLASAIAIITIISFLDDIKGLHQIPRLISQLLATLIIFYSTGILGLPWYVQFVAAVLLIGWINTFNFMDGINGIMVLYALVNLGSFYYMSDQPNQQELLIIIIISSVIFAFFNVRKKAKTFAGDVGSVSLAFILGYFLIDLILQSERWEYILFFSVYGIDSVATILFRLKKRENIFEAHRSHLYQFLANELKCSHIKVSAIYSVIQLAINIIVILGIEYGYLTTVNTLLLLLILSIIYIFIRKRVKSLISVS